MKYWHKARLAHIQLSEMIARVNKSPESTEVFPSFRGTCTVRF